MSRRDVRGQDFWSDRVPFKTLGDLGYFVRGNGIQKSDLVDIGFPAIHYGQIHTFYRTAATETLSFVAPDFAKTLRKAEPGDLIIATTSEDDDAVGRAVAWLGRTSVAVSGDASIYHHSLLPEYVAYLFQSGQFQDQKRRWITGTKVRRISGDSLAKIRIPVPPLEVQHEIVQVLDRFTPLEAALEAELEARRFQYAHYRRQLLTFSKAEVRWLRLGDIAEVRSGWGFPHMYQGQTEGDYPFYKVSDMNLAGNEAVMTISNNYIDRDTAKKLGVSPVPAGTLIFPKIGAAIATNKKRLLSVDSAYDNNVIGVIPGPHLESRFLFHWMHLVDLTRLAHNSGAVPSIRKKELEELKVPVLPSEDQRRVSSILDKFDALVHDLSSGLPAELNARRTQYAYYRDRLLTFKEWRP